MIRTPLVFVSDDPQSTVRLRKDRVCRPASASLPKLTLCIAPALMTYNGTIFQFEFH